MTNRMADAKKSAMSSEYGEMLAAFNRNHTGSIDPKGKTFTISCKKGLWSVTAPTIDRATNEALHYFQQYYADGEYDT